MSNKSTHHYLYAARGEAHYKAQLTVEDVQLIRELARQRAGLLEQARKITNAKIAEKFGVTAGTIDKVINRERWGHVA